MDEDETLLEQVLAGDVTAFEALIERHRRYVFAIIFRHGPREMAEGVAHEVFVHAYHALPDLRDRKAFRGWLATIAVRKCYDFFRTRSRRREIPLSALSQESAEWLGKVEREEAQSRFESEEARSAAQNVLQWALDALSPEDRMVVTLVHLEEYPVKEAAQLLGWSVTNVKIRAYRARQKLRKIIETREQK